MCQAWVPGLWCSVPLAQADEGGHRLCRTFCAGDHQGTGGPVGGGLKRPGRSPGRPSSLRLAPPRLLRAHVPERAPHAGGLGGRARCAPPHMGRGPRLTARGSCSTRWWQYGPCRTLRARLGASLALALAPSWVALPSLGARGARASPGPCTVLDRLLQPPAAPPRPLAPRARLGQRWTLPAAPPGEPACCDTARPEGRGLRTSGPTGAGALAGRGPPCSAPPSSLSLACHPGASGESLPPKRLK